MANDPNIVPGCGRQPRPGTAEYEAEEGVKKKLEAARLRSKLTDAQFLSEYAEGQRVQALRDVASYEEYLKQAQASRDYVHTYGTDEG